MARYDHLPIYRAAFDLAVHLEQIVRHFDRYHKYTLGTDLRTGSRRILERIIEANESRERRLVLEQLRQDLERLKVLARLCHESGGFRSTRAYLYVAEQVVALARQNEGWLRSTAAPADLRYRDRSVVTDPGGAQGSATVTVAITTAGESPCQDRRVTCAAVGAGLLGPAQTIAFEFSAWSTRGRTGGQLSLLDGRFRLVGSAVQSLDIVGHAAVIRGTGSVNGRAGYSFEAYAQDRPSARDTLRVVVRDRGGLVVKDVGGEVTRGDLTTVVVR